MIKKHYFRADRKLIMNIDDKIHKEMKNATMTLTEKQQKY